MEAKIGSVLSAGEATKMTSLPFIHHIAYIIITVRDLDLILLDELRKRISELHEQEKEQQRQQQPKT